MKVRTLAVMAMAIAFATPVLAADPPRTLREVLASREGVAELSQAEVAGIVGVVVQDARYVGLEQVAQERHLILDPAKATGLAFKEGYQAVFVMAFDEQGKESGFLANSGESWTLSLSINRQKKSVIEAFAARTDSDGTVVIEAQVPKVDVHEQGFVAPPQTDSYSTACQYVPSYGISFGCWSLPDNPLGYYYTTVYRYGQTTDPYSQWWACWQGSIHVCPQIEHPSSPFTWITCGFPPSHPQG